MKEISVIVGGHNMSAEEPSRIRHQVQLAVPHKLYRSDRNYYDIMLLKLRKSIQFNDKVGPICVDDEKFPSDTTCFVSGWGVFNTSSTYYTTLFLEVTRNTASAPHRPQI